MVFFEVTYPFGRIMLSTEHKYIQFQSICRPLETHPWNSCMRINNLRKSHFQCLWTWLLQANVNGNKIQCKTRTDRNMHWSPQHKGPEQGGQAVEDGEGTRSWWQGSKTEEGVTVSARRRAAVPNTHIHHPHFTDEEDRLGETRSQWESCQVAKLGVEPGLSTSAWHPHHPCCHRSKPIRMGNRESRRGNHQDPNTHLPQGLQCQPSWLTGLWPQGSGYQKGASSGGSEGVRPGPRHILHN